MEHFIELLIFVVPMLALLAVLAWMAEFFEKKAEERKWKNKR